MAKRPASRSAGTKQAPAAHFIRFTEAWNVKLHEAAAHAGMSIQGFVSAAAVEAIKKELETKRQEDEYEKLRRPSRQPARGMGIRERLEQETARFDEVPTDDVAETRQADEAPAPIASASMPKAPVANDMVQKLAAFVVKDGQGSRTDRLKMATQILRGSVTEQAAAVQLARDLDDEIARLDRLDPPKPSKLFSLFDGIFD